MTALLRAVDLHAGYQGMAVVRDIRLEIAPGRIVALLGPNGAGKTTTLLTLAGVLRPLAGRVEWRGVSSSAPLHHRTRDGMQLLTEQRRVFSKLTVDEHLRLVRGHHMLETFPELEALRERRVGLCSGGEQQLLAVACALAARPAVLLADELSFGLAPRFVDRILAVLSQAASAGVGVLLVEQQVGRALDVADEAIVLRNGTVSDAGPAAELRGRLPDLQAAYL